jgi:hypothetical protein
MRVNTKDKIDEDLRKLVGDLKEEPKKDTTHIEIRRERVGEMPKQAQERLAKIFDDEIASPEIKDKKDGAGLSIYYKNDEELGLLALISTFGVTYGDFTVQQLNGLLQASGTAKDSMEDLGKKASADINIVAALEPRDAVESMLAVQMTATHRAIMTAARQLNNSEMLDQSNSAANRMTKLMNVYTRQVETLNKHRGKGQQKMTVEHVHVNEGGQAIIGTVEGGGCSVKKEGQPHALRSED